MSKKWARFNFSLLSPLFTFRLTQFNLRPLQIAPYNSQGQFSEENILDNNENSPLFEEFLQLLGDKVRLRGFDKYKGGLGEYCIVMHESGCGCSTWIRSKTPSGEVEIRLLNRKQGYICGRDSTARVEKPAPRRMCWDRNINKFPKSSVRFCPLIFLLHRHRSRFNRTL